MEYDGASDVRRSAAEALGKLGPEAREAVPKLIAVMQNEEETYQVRESVVRTLGKIGDKTAVPELVALLYKDDRISNELAPISAKALAKITGERFTDSLEKYDIFELKEDGTPIIVIDARRWWEETGQYQDWTEH